MKPILKVENLTTTFQGEEGRVTAVSDLSFELGSGETLAVVGESGCGKSVTALSILNLIPHPPGRIEHGQIWFEDRDLTKLCKREMRKVRGNDIAMIFQEPMTSLNPVFTVGSQVMGSLIIHQKMRKKLARQAAVTLLDAVGIPEPALTVDRYPHQLSGGMRQRAMIAMALACRPKILIADEPTTALDVTIQAQILNLLKNLHEERNMSIILITHDMGVVAQLADRVLVMYAGEAVEYRLKRDLFKSPYHPYTEGLLKSIPSLSEEQSVLYTIPGSVPPVYADIKGCRFADRCARVQPHCVENKPLLRLYADGNVRCHFPLKDD